MSRNPKKRWTVERWDAAWGGWRRVAKSFLDDSPCEFVLKRDADAAADSLRLRDRGARRYRVTEVPQKTSP